MTTGKKKTNLISFFIYLELKRKSKKLEKSSTIWQSFNLRRMYTNHSFESFPGYRAKVIKLHVLETINDQHYTCIQALPSKKKKW